VGCEERDWERKEWRRRGGGGGEEREREEANDTASERASKSERQIERDRDSACVGELVHSIVPL